MNQVKTFWLLPLIMGMIACSGGGTNSSSVERNTNSGSTSEEVEPTPTEPVTVLLDGNIYFPVADGVTWHYSNGDAVTFESGRTVQGNAVIAMKHTSSGMPSEEYVAPTSKELRYGGLATQISFPTIGNADVRVEFKNTRRIYNHDLDRGENVLLSASGYLIEAISGVSQAIDYDWKSTVESKSMVDAGAFGQVPAVEILIDFDLIVLLDRYQVVTTSLWLSPGLGIVARKFGETVISLDHVEGLQKPVVFEFDQGDGLSQAPQQVLIDGSAVTDISVTTAIAYGTTQTGWLDLDYDGTGSWRVSLIGAELPAGIHAAVVQVTQNGKRVDVPVSVLVH